MQQEISVENVSGTLQILRSFDKETLKAVNKEIYQEVKPLVGQSRALVPDMAPMSGWAKPNSGEWGTRLLWDTRKVKMGIRTQIKPMRQRGTNIRERTLFLAQANPAGVVYEWAGRKTKGQRSQGQQFVRNIEDRSGITVIGKQSRIIWGVVLDNRKKITANTEAILRRYMNTYSNKLAA
jgi:hypothetical protein